MIWFEIGVVNADASSGPDKVHVRTSAKSMYCQDLILEISFVGMGGMPSVITIVLAKVSIGGDGTSLPFSRSPKDRLSPPSIPLAGREDTSVGRNPKPVPIDAVESTIDK